MVEGIEPFVKANKVNFNDKIRDQCEIKLAEMIEQVKVEIAEEKAKLKEGGS